MITYKLFVIVILFTTGVLSRNTHRGNIRHRQPDEDYKYNHPPEPETYEAIPVAVLYDEDSNRNDKSIKSDISTKNNVEQVTKEPPKSDSYIDNSPIPTKEDIDHVVPTPVQAQAEDQSSNGKVPDKPTASLAVQSEQEQQIPVAVVYEPEASYYNEPRPKVQRVSSKRRKVQRPQVQDEQLEEEKKIEDSVKENENIPNARVPDTQERFSSRDKSTPTSTSNARVPGTQERFRSRDKNTPTPTFNARAPDTQEQFNSRDKNTPAPTTNARIPDTQEQFSSHDENTFAPTSSAQVPDTQESFKSRDKNTLAPTSNPQVPDTQEQFSNSDESVPIRDFAKRNNSTRQREVVPIIQSENLVFSHTGDFQYSYEGGDGTKAFEKGQLKTFEDDNAGEAVSGGFSYTAKDGNEYSLSYTADENGYRPVGAHLPTPPPIPPAIARALAYLATKPTPEPVTESSYEADYS